MDIKKELVGIDNYNEKLEKIDELILLLKTEKKSIKEEFESTYINSIKSRVKIGDTVVAKFKQDEIIGEVVSVREKTFSLLTEDKLTTNGDPSVVSRKYSLIISINNEEI